MVNQNAYQLGANRSCIRDLFEYGRQRAAIVGEEKVSDYTLGNPSIPSPAAVDEAQHHAVVQGAGAFQRVVHGASLLDDVEAFHIFVPPEKCFYVMVRCVLFSVMALSYPPNIRGKLEKLK